MASSLAKLPDKMRPHLSIIVPAMVVVIYFVFLEQKRPAIRADARSSIDPLPTLPTRDALGGLLQQLNMTVGAELGVQSGGFAKITLDQWPHAKKYILVDLWRQQENYKDVANVDDQAQENLKREALNNLQMYRDKLVVCRNYTSVCGTQFEDGYFDYIYVDARHDYKGVREDIEIWWRKLRVGGIMAGHDYIDAEEVARISGQDWSVSADGTVNPDGKAVKSAVDEWATQNKLVLQITYRDAPWNTWVTRKIRP